MADKVEQPSHQQRQDESSAFLETAEIQSQSSAINGASSDSKRQPVCRYCIREEIVTSFEEPLPPYSHIRTPGQYCSCTCGNMIYATYYHHAIVRSTTEAATDSAKLELIELNKPPVGDGCISNYCCPGVHTPDPEDRHTKKDLPKDIIYHINYDKPLYTETEMDGRHTQFLTDKKGPYKSKYCIFCNNCEHLVNNVLWDKPEGEQAGHCCGRVCNVICRLIVLLVRLPKWTRWATLMASSSVDDALSTVDLLWLPWLCSAIFIVLYITICICKQCTLYKDHICQPCRKDRTILLWIGLMINTAFVVFSTALCAHYIEGKMLALDINLGLRVLIFIFIGVAFATVSTAVKVLFDNIYKHSCGQRGRFNCRSPWCCFRIRPIVP